MATAGLFFIIGGSVFYIPLYRLRKRISQLIKNKNHPPPSDYPPPNIDTQLNQYIQQLEQKQQHTAKIFNLLQNNIQAVSSYITDYIICLNRHGKLLYYNPQSQDLFNIRSFKKEHYLNEIIRSPDVVDLFHECLEKGQNITKRCSFNVKNQYFHRSFKVTAVPLKQFKEEQHCVVLLFYDRTAIKASKKAHIDFVSNVSHELKTPLTAMQGYVEILISDLSRKKLDQFHKFLNILLKNCRRIGALVDDLLILSHLSSEEEIEKKQLNTKEVTHEVIAGMPKQSHQLHFSFSAPLVFANLSLLESILHNLIDNACRHTPEGGNIYICWEEENKQVALKVRDSGEGIPKKYQYRIFERFFRMDPSRSRQEGGTGVGLALVKQSMKKHGGWVKVATAQTGGSEFICEFPKQ